MPPVLILKKPKTEKSLWDIHATTYTLISVPNSNPLRTGVSVTYPPLTIRKNYESAVARGSTPRFGIFQNHLLSSRPVHFFGNFFFFGRTLDIFFINRYNRHRSGRHKPVSSINLFSLPGSKCRRLRVSRSYEAAV